MATRCNSRRSGDTAKRRGADSASVDLLDGWRESPFSAATHSIRLRATEMPIRPEEWPLVQVMAREHCTSVAETVICFDTPDFHLWRNRVNLCLRQTPSGWYQCIEWSRPTLRGPVAKRLTVPIAGHELNMEIAQQSMDRHLKGAYRVSARQLQQMVQITATRSHFILQHPQHAPLDLIEEKGCIETPSHGRSLFHEVVLSSRKRLDAWFFEAALTLAHPWQPAFVSSTPIERHMRWCCDPLFRPAGQLSVPRAVPMTDGSMEAVLVQIGTLLWHQMVDAHATILYSHERHHADGLKKLMTAVRHLRLLIRTYAGFTTPRMAETVEPELAWLEESLTSVYQWQTFLVDGVYPFIHQFYDIPDVLTLQQVTVERHLEQKRALFAVLDSFRVTRLLLGMGHWVTGRVWRQPMDRLQRQRMAMPLLPALGSVLDRHYQQLLQLDRRIEGVDWTGGLAVQEQADALSDLIALFSTALDAQSDGTVSGFRQHLYSFCDAIDRFTHLHAFSQMFVKVSPNAEQLRNVLFHEWVRERSTAIGRDIERIWTSFTQSGPCWR